MEEILKLTYLLASKICHDLATPLGSMSLGIDMAGDPAMDEMLKQSLDSANLKLKFYRTLLTPSESAPPFSDINQSLRDFCSKQNIKLTWGDIDADTFQGTQGRILLGLGYIAIETLLKGGNLYIQSEKNVLKISAKGNVCQLRDTYLEAFEKQDLSLSKQNARTVLPYYLLCLAHLSNSKVTLNYQNHVQLDITVELMAT